LPKDISTLIPIKKPVTDIQKGLIIRTYYYKPQTLLKQLEKLKEEPNINYYTETPFYDDYETYLKTGDKSSFSTLFDRETWLKISNLNNNQENNKHYESKFVYPLTSFLFSGDKIFLKNFRKDIRQSTKEVAIQPIEYRFKSSKSYLAPYKEVKYYNVTKVANLLSNLINYYNPRKPKIVEIVKKLVGSDYIDDSGIIHHCIFSERIIDREKDLFLNILKANINIFYSTLLESKLDLKHLSFYIPYFLVQIFKIDVNEFENVIKTYYFSETIREFINTIKLNKLSDKINILYSQIVNMPKSELIKYLNNTLLDKMVLVYDIDYLTIKALSQRIDISPREFDHLIFKFLSKYDIFDKNTLISELLLYFFENEPPSLLVSIYLFMLHQYYNKFPIMFIKDFKGCEPERGSILFLLQNSNFTLNYILNKVLKLQEVNQTIRCFIPIIKKENEFYINEPRFPFRLLEFHLATTNENLLKNKYLYIELEVNKYYRINNELIFISI